jgi:hypothetical protein
MYYFMLDDSTTTQSCSGCNAQTRGLAATDEELANIPKPITPESLPAILQANVGRCLCPDCYKKTVTSIQKEQPKAPEKEPETPKLPQPWPPVFKTPPQVTAGEPLQTPPREAGPEQAPQENPVQ